MSRLRDLILLTRPVQLIFCILAYWLGLGLAHYLGSTIQVEPQILAGCMVLFVFSASNMLTEYFRNVGQPFKTDETSKQREEFRSLLLLTSSSLLVIASLLIFILIKDGYMYLEVTIILVIFIILTLLRSIPPFRLANRGLAELSASIELACLSSGLAFLFQYGNFHRVLTIYTLPILFLALAYFLVGNFTTYSTDLKFGRRTMLISLTWQRTITIHNLLLVFSYLFFAGIPFFGLPIGLVWPAFLTLPLAIYQVFSMRNLADGGKPNWPILKANAAAIFGLTTYFVSLTFWLR